jgi:cell division transport system permease protein
MKQYVLRHLQVFFSTLGAMARAPLATLMTVTVIGITLALPAGLYVLVQNLQRVSGHLAAGGEISLFLKHNVSSKAAEALATELRRQAGIGKVEYISPDAALAELRATSGFGDALKALDDNPLPGVLVVTPAAAEPRPGALRELAAELGHRGEVDFAQLDLEWVQRLHAILTLAERGVWLLAGLLALAVLLIIGNTIRLAVLNRREEIAITRLIGATPAFIRRPFLYAGALHGLLGALAAWLLVSGSILLLSGPARDLATLYASSVEIEGFGADAGFALLGIGLALGWLGSRIAVGRHLRGPASTDL